MRVRRRRQPSRAATAQQQRLSPRAWTAKQVSAGVVLRKSKNPAAVPGRVCAAAALGRLAVAAFASIRVSSPLALVFTAEPAAPAGKRGRGGPSTIRTQPATRCQHLATLASLAGQACYFGPVRHCFWGQVGNGSEACRRLPPRRCPPIRRPAPIVGQSLWRRALCRPVTGDAKKLDWQRSCVVSLRLAPSCSVVRRLALRAGHAQGGASSQYLPARFESPKPAAHASAGPPPTPAPPPPETSSASSLFAPSASAAGGCQCIVASTVLALPNFNIRSPQLVRIKRRFARFVAMRAVSPYVFARGGVLRTEGRLRILASEAARVPSAEASTAPDVRISIFANICRILHCVCRHCISPGPTRSSCALFGFNVRTLRSCKNHGCGLLGNTDDRPVLPENPFPPDGVAPVTGSECHARPPFFPCSEHCAAENSNSYTRYRNHRNVGLSTGVTIKDNRCPLAFSEPHSNPCGRGCPKKLSGRARFRIRRLSLPYVP